MEITNHTVLIITPALLPPLFSPPFLFLFCFQHDAKAGFLPNKQIKTVWNFYLFMITTTHPVLQKVSPTGFLFTPLSLKFRKKVIILCNSAILIFTLEEDEDGDEEEEPTTFLDFQPCVAKMQSKGTYGIPHTCLWIQPLLEQTYHPGSMHKQSCFAFKLIPTLIWMQNSSIGTIIWNTHIELAKSFGSEWGGRYISSF